MFSDIACLAQFSPVQRNRYRRYTTTYINQKKRKYLESSLKEKRHFTLFIVWYKGLVVIEADTFVSRLIEKLSSKWSYPCSHVMKTRFTISPIQAKVRWIRSLRISLHDISQMIG